MRISPYWKEYNKIEDQYRRNNCDIPDSIKSDYRAKEYLACRCRDLNKCADRNAISNAMWELLVKIQEYEKDPHTSEDVAESIDIAIREMTILYSELKEENNGFLIDRNTLTRKGRKRVRESADRISVLLKRLH